MPSYTYECTNKECQYQFTIEEDINDIHEAYCPKCGIKSKRIFKPIASTWKCEGSFGKSK